MGDPLRNLEEQLEALVPRGLSDSGRDRLHLQIDELAGSVEDATRSRRGGRLGIGVAAAVAALLGAVLVYNAQIGPGAPGGVGMAPTVGAAVVPRPGIETGWGFETVDYDRTVGDAEDGGIVLDEFDEPVRAWNYAVRETELVVDQESGMHVRIVQERREQVRVAVTSF